MHLFTFEFVYFMFYSNLITNNFVQKYTKGLFKRLRSYSDLTARWASVATRPRISINRTIAHVHTYLEKDIMDEHRFDGIWQEQNVNKMTMVIDVFFQSSPQFISDCRLNINKN